MSSRLPLTYEYNLDLQYEFAKGWVADLGYVGSHSIHLYNWSQDINVAKLVSGAPNNPTAAAGHQNAEMIASSLPFNDPANPIATQVTTNVGNCFACGPPQFSNINNRVAYLGFGPGGVATTNTNGDALYNSLQAELRHQFSHGLLIQASYTWSQGITNVNTAEAGSGINPPGEVLYGSTNSNDPLDTRQQYGPSAFNRTQRAVISYVYNLPWKNEQGFTGKALSGWSISGVTTIQNGLPFSITDSAGATIYGAGTARAALAQPTGCSTATGNCKSVVPLISSGSTTQRAETNWLNPSAFTSMCTANAFTGLLATSCTAPLPADSPYCIGGVANPSGGSGARRAVGPDRRSWGQELAMATRRSAAFLGRASSTSTLRSSRPRSYGSMVHCSSGRSSLTSGTTRSLIRRSETTSARRRRSASITSTSTTPRVIQFGLKYLF